jgi:hypothetical protein
MMRWMMEARRLPTAGSFLLAATSRFADLFTTNTWESEPHDGKISRQDGPSLF